MSDLQPDLEEVLQAEPPPGVNEEMPVAVVVKGVVREQSLPLKASSSRTWPIGAAGAGVQATRILQADHRRARATIMAIGGAMRIAFNSAAKEDPSRMALWPANVAYTHLADDDVWVAADTVAITVSVITSRWAVGEDGGR